MTLDEENVALDDPNEKQPQIDVVVNDYEQVGDEGKADVFRYYNGPERGE